MIKFQNLRNRTRKTRGQINIAETIVSATLILVLAFSIAQVGTKIAETTENDTFESLKDRAQNALNIGLSTGILRNLAFANDTDSSPYKIQMKSLIDNSLPFSAQYSLVQKTLDNSSHFLNNRILLGLDPIPSGNLNILVVSIFLSGHFNSSVLIEEPFIVSLIVVVGQF